MLSPGSGNTVIKSKLISRRMFLLTAAKAVVMVGLVGRLISLQINQATKYKSLSDKNRFREWKLAPERGAIKDFFNIEIASNEPLYQVHLIPETLKTTNLDSLVFGDEINLELDQSTIAIVDTTERILKHKTQ